MCKVCNVKTTASQKQDYHNLRFYGLTAEQRVDLEKKFPTCAICGKGGKLHIDHNHETGLVRGRLCGECNRGIGVFKDSPLLLQKAIEYLVFQTRWNGVYWSTPGMKRRALAKALGAPQ